MIFTKQPSAIQAALNPVTVKVALTDEEKQMYDSGTVRLLITSNWVDYYIDSDIEDNIAQFDLSGTLKYIFEDLELDTLPPTFNRYAVINRLISFEYHMAVGRPVDGDEKMTDSVWLYNLTAVNSAVPLGYSPDMSGYNIFLTRQKRLKKYSGYPLSITCVNSNRYSDLLFDGNFIQYGIINSVFEVNIPDGVAQVAYSLYSALEDLTTDDGAPVTTDDGTPVTVFDKNVISNLISIKIDSPCIPDSPFYVRWLSISGGYDYYMFQYRQTLENKIDDSDIFYPCISDIETAKGAVRQLFVKGQEKITAGASMLDSQEYGMLSKLIYSPYIEWYNKDIEKWLTVTVDDSNIEKDTRTGTGSIEITFNLPAPQLLF
jgi:hypothetical protein